MRAALIAHSGGVGPDEIAIVAIPIVILVVLQVIGRRKAVKGNDDPAPAGRRTDQKKDT